MKAHTSKKEKPRLIMDEVAMTDYSHAETAWILDLDQDRDSLDPEETQRSFSEGIGKDPQECNREGETNNAINILSLSSEWPELQAMSYDEAYSPEDGENNKYKDAELEDISSMQSWDEVDQESEAWDIVSDISVKSFNTFSSYTVDMNAQTEATSYRYRDAVMKSCSSATKSGFPNKSRTSGDTPVRNIRCTCTPSTLTTLEEDHVENDDLFCFRSGVKEAKGGKARFKYRGNPKTKRFHTSRASKLGRSFDQLGRAEMAKSRRSELKAIVRTSVQS